MGAGGPKVIAGDVAAGLSTGGLAPLIKYGIVEPQKRQARELKEQGERQVLEQQRQAAEMARRIREAPKKVDPVTGAFPASERRRLLRMGVAQSIRTSAAGLGAPAPTTSGDKRLLGQ